MRDFGPLRPDLQIVELYAGKRRSHTHACVHNKNGHVWLDSLTNLDHLLEEFSFLFVATTSIDNDYIKALLLELGHTLGCDANRIRLCI